MVSEQVMTADAKSKAAANLLRFRFIDVFGFEFLFSTSGRCLLFGSRINVFLLGKAETAVQTRQVFVDALRRAGAFPSAISRRVNKRCNYKSAPLDRSSCTSCSRSPKTPATFSNRLVLKPRKGSGIDTSQAHPRLAHLKLRAHFLNFFVLLFETRPRSPCDLVFSALPTAGLARVADCSSKNAVSFSAGPVSVRSL